MPAPRWSVVLCGIPAAAIAFAASAADAPLPTVEPEAPANRFCPVLPHQPVRPGKFLMYRGRKVFVCCDDCMAVFESRPLDFLSALPQFSAAEASDLPATDYRKKWTAVLDSLVAFERDVRPFLVGAAVLLLLHLIALQRVRRAAAPEARSAPRWCRVLARGVNVGLILLAGLSAQLAALYFRPAPPAARKAPAARNPDADFRAFHRIHRQLLLQSADQPGFRHTLKLSYYRGNDERYPALFNGGNYRTCTMNLSLRTEDGREIAPGDDVSGRRLFVRLELVRAPFTSDALFRKDQMTTYGLMAGNPRPWESGADRPSRRVGLTVLTPDWKWEALYPLTDEDPAPVEIERLIYFGPCQPNTPVTQLSSAAHYAVGCRLVLRDGRLQPESELWMAAVLVAGQFAEPEMYQWFGLRPLPEIPQAQKATPRELGLDEAGNPIPAKPERD
jgi:hypothetical protein